MTRFGAAVAFSLFAAAPVVALQTGAGGQGAGRGATAHGPNAIVGRVTGRGGQPVTGVFMTALRPVAASPARPFTFVSAKLYAETDAAGSYRLDGLPVGDYFIVALPSNDPALSRTAERAGYGKTFFPNASETTHARLVHVDGVTPGRADVSLVPARVAVVSGVVIGSSGQPVRGGTLELSHGDNLFGLGSRAYRLVSTGDFVIASVPPGTYFLQFHESPWPPARDEIPVVSQARVVVSGDDVSGVRVVPIHMVEASGHVVMAREIRAAIDPTAVTIGASPVSFDGNPGPQRAGTLRADLTFSFKAWPGPGRIRVLPEGEWYVTSVRLNGADLTNTPIEFAEGRDIHGLEVHVARRR